MDELKKIVVIGASAGGYHAIADVVAALPADPEIAVFAVLHMSKDSAAAVVLHHLQLRTSLACKIAADNEPIKGGHLYLAPPDHHLMVKKGLMRVHNGPRENRWRPSIDVLFRSAAAAYGSQVIGIILSGLLDDGTSGMSAIKRSGGICIVQEPKEALFPDMPTNVLNTVDVDYRVPLADIGYIITDHLSKPPARMLPVPEDVRIEAEITERMVSSMDELKKIGTHSNFSCPDCGGGLWKMSSDGVHRYRCYTGHVYTERLLNDKQREELEASLWVSIRILEERKNLLTIMAGHELEAGHTPESVETKKRAGEVDVHINRLKSVLHAMDKPASATI
ncbi:MAG: Protein-glutamate methylesterase [Mucilaginibacter sp.]|nr:Protein-glutamate methylesterase [Mucilaginibacter sp.]